LSDYLQTVQILGGTRATTIQSLQLHLTGAARSWLNTLPNDSIGSWGELEGKFARNFHSTYKRPASLEEVKLCRQGRDKTLRSYIQRWIVIKNSAEDVSDERATDAFSAGLHRLDPVEEIGRTKPRTVLELMEIANRFADGEDAYNNKRGRSPEVDKSSRKRRHISKEFQGPTYFKRILGYPFPLPLAAKPCSRHSQARAMVVHAYAPKAFVTAQKKSPF
jgi:hypothetical protein